MSDQRTTPSDPATPAKPMTPSAEQAMASSSLWRRGLRLAAVSERATGARGFIRALWKSPVVAGSRQALGHWVKKPHAGVITLLIGSIIITLLFWLSSQFFPVPNLGAIYIPLIAMLAYYWRWRLAIAASVVQLLAVYLLLLPPGPGVKPLNSHTFV